MADEQPIQKLSVNFDSLTFTYKRLAKDLKCSLSALTCFVREYRDPVVKTDRCAQYVDDVGLAANTRDQPIKNIERVLQCIGKAELKPSMDTCLLVWKKNEFRGKTISSEGIGPVEMKIDDILDFLKLLMLVKSLQKYIGFVNFYRQYLANVAGTLIPL